MTSEPHGAASHSDVEVTARVTAVVAVVFLTLLTQIGGLVLLLVWGLNRLRSVRRAIGAWRRAVINALLFVVAYAAISVHSAAFIAALAGTCAFALSRPT